MVYQYEVVALTQCVFVLKICVPLLYLVVQFLFQLVHILYSLLVLGFFDLWNKGITAWHTRACTVVIFKVELGNLFLLWRLLDLLTVGLFAKLAALRYHSSSAWLSLVWAYLSYCTSYDLLGQWLSLIIATDVV